MLIVALRSALRSCSAVGVSPSRNLCSMSSSFSATDSTSCIRKASAFFRRFVGDLFNVVLRAHGLVVPENGLHLDQIDDALEAGFLADRDLDRDRTRIQALANRIDCMLEVSARLVHLVDEANAGNAVLVRLTPHCFRLRLDTVNGVKAGDGAVEYAERTLHLGGKVHVARRVDNVDEDVLPGACRRGGCNRDAALLLLLHPVHRCGTFVHFPDTVRDARIEQDALGRSRLPGVDVRHDSDVPATI